MGAVLNKVQRLAERYQDLPAAEKREYRAAIVAVVKRRFPNLTDVEAWRFFRDAPARQQLKAIGRAKADIQTEAIREALEPRIPYERTVGPYTYRINEVSVRQREDLIIRMRITLEKGGVDITPADIKPYYQIIGCPVLVVDPAGEIEQSFTDANGEVHTRRVTENPLRALRADVEDRLRALIQKYKL